MKQSSNSLFWGATILGLGLLLLAKTLGWFHIDWGQTLRFWPLLLVGAGLSLLARQSWSSVFTAILIAFAIPAAILNKTHHKLQDWERDGIEFNIDEDDDEDNEEQSDNDSDNDIDKDYDQTHSVSSNNFTEPFTAGTQEATLDFGAGAGKFTIEGTTSELIKADTKSDFGTYILTHKRNDAEKRSVISLKMDGKDSTKVKLKNFDGDKNKVSIELNKNPIWSFDIGLGAGKGDFDLSEYKVKKVSLEAGAADINLKLGEGVQSNTDIDIDAGVASIDIDIPQSIGCEIMIDGALNSKDFDNFEKVKDGLYRTSNYNNATKKVKINYTGGLSKIEVNRY